jgi:hypothetical protein
MKSRADWANRQGNSARCFLYFLNEFNSGTRRRISIAHSHESA